MTTKKHQMMKLEKDLDVVVVEVDLSNLVLVDILTLNHLRQNQPAGRCYCIVVGVVMMVKLNDEKEEEELFAVKKIKKAKFHHLSHRHKMENVELLQREIHLLENLRFHKGEINNDPSFSKKLSEHADVYVNDAFGGQNWENIANRIQTPWLKSMMQTTFAPGSRGYMQLLMFAPDWTISNIRIIAKSLPAFESDPGHSY